MTKLPSPEQWVLARMDERECAELIEQHIDFYVENKRWFSPFGALTVAVRGALYAAA